MSKIIGKIRPIRDRVIVSDMHFGEQRSSGGIVILGDDGKDRGIYPRWGKVYAVGPEHKEEFTVGDWVLIEHGRWTRGVLLDDGENEKTIRMVDNKCILLWSKEKPNDANIAKTIEVPTANEAYRI
jgi:co-chaperonin GroES (HSP10)